LDSTIRDHHISVVIPTLGRAQELTKCLESLSKQTVPVSEILIVHCGQDHETQLVANDLRWQAAGIDVRYYSHQVANAARQRNFAIQHASYDNVLLLDDDIEVDPHWAEELFKPIWADKRVGATMGRITNQPMPNPTPFWRIYRVILHGRQKGLKAGRLVGAALPNGFPSSANELIACEWIGGGVSALRREAFQSIGGFASFFTGSSPGEDLDLGYRISRHWKVYYVPSATCVHHQSPTGREERKLHQYLSMKSRFGILKVTMAKSRIKALTHIAVWATVQGLSELASTRRGKLPKDLLKAWRGRLDGFIFCLRWHPESESRQE
jgi:GT2 family glycosyltransferase